MLFYCYFLLKIAFRICEKIRGVMFTSGRIKVVVVLLLIVVTTAWSKLRLLEPEDHEPQRWRVEEYPGFQK